MQKLPLFRVGRSKAHGWEIEKQRGGCRSRPFWVLHVSGMGHFRSACCTVSIHLYKVYQILI